MSRLLGWQEQASPARCWTLLVWWYPQLFITCGNPNRSTFPTQTFDFHSDADSSLSIQADFSFSFYPCLSGAVVPFLLTFRKWRVNRALLVCLGCLFFTARTFPSLNPTRPILFNFPKSRHKQTQCLMRSGKQALLHLGLRQKPWVGDLGQW